MTNAETATAATAAEILDARLVEAAQHTAVDTAVLREENSHLRELLARKQAFAQKLEQTLVELQNERDAVDAEVRRLLSPQEWQELTSAFAAASSTTR